MGRSEGTSSAGARGDPLLSEEWRVVLEGTRSALGLSGEKDTRTPPCSEPIDWDAVSDIAYQQRVAPLLHRGLEDSGLPVPSSCRQALKRAYVANAAHNAAIFRTLAGVLEAFAADGIDTVALKGAGLAEAVYRDRALRPMNDVDLLVREDELERAERALRRAGFEPEPGPLMPEELKETHHHWRFRGEEPPLAGVPIELHWRLDPPGWPWRIDLDALWGRAVSTPIAGGSALVFAPDDLLVTLPLPVCRHRFRGGLISLCDVAAIVATHGERIDWRAVAERAIAWRAGAYVAIVLELTAELLRCPVPRSFFDALGGVPDSDEMLALARARSLEEKGALGEAAELGLRWKRSGSKARLAAAGRRVAAVKDPSAFARRAARDAASLWTWMRHPVTAAAVARREARASALDEWCSPKKQRS